MKYEALLAHDISCYATIEFEAESDEAAVVKARRLLSLEDKDGDISYDPEWSGLWNERIVLVEKIDDGKHECVAEDIDLNPNPLHDNALTLLQAAKEAEEAARLAGIHQTLDADDCPWYAKLKAAIAKCEAK